MMKSFGIILIVLGCLFLTYQGLNYGKEAQAGDRTFFGMSEQETKYLWLLPVIGVIDLGAGLALLGTRKTWIGQPEK